MSPLGRQWPSLVCLLTVLWAVGQAEAEQPPPTAYAGTSPNQDLLLNLIVHEVTSVVQPLVGKLSARIDRLDSRLIDVNSRLSGIETRLNDIDFSHRSVTSGLAELVSRVDSVENGLGSRLDDLANRVDSTESRIDSRLNELISQTNSTERRLDSRLNELVSQEGRSADRQSSYLDNVTSRLDQQSSRLDSLASLAVQGAPNDCSQLTTGTQSGVYMLLLNGSLPAVPAFCDMDTDGRWWTVIQRRADILPRQDFYLPWSDYKDGFGDLNKEFWWGLEKVWQMTGATDRQYQLRIELADFDGGRRHALYGRFWVSSEADGYRLSLADYSGDAGDSLMRDHNGMKFSTKDRDLDGSSTGHCAQGYKGAWWFKSCGYSHLNGPYLRGKRQRREGVQWNHWRGGKYSLKETVMKIRPVPAD